MKTRVFGCMHWIILSLNVIDAMCVLMIFFSDQLKEMTTEELIFALFVVILMMIILPIGLLLYSLLTFNNIVLINEKGVYRIRFKKVIKKFNWSEIKTIGFTSNDSFTGWTYISILENVEYSYLEISKMRLNKNNIYFHLTQKNRIKLESIINKYFNK